MRGKPRAKTTNHVEFGITPADAGKTMNEHIPLLYYKDHPRGCGENL